MPELKVIVPGGKATPGPPLGPAIAPLGVNVGQLVAKLNEKTKAFEGIEVPVKIIVKADKTFDIEVGTPAVPALLKKELGTDKGAGTKDATCGDLGLDKIIKVAKMKKDALMANSDAALVNQVLGTCVSMGATVEGKKPQEVQKEILSGKRKISL
jgi:large subunit ribosomal protein L11